MRSKTESSGFFYIFYFLADTYYVSRVPQENPVRAAGAAGGGMAARVQDDDWAEEGEEAEYGEDNEFGEEDEAASAFAEGRWR